MKHYISIHLCGVGIVYASFHFMFLTVFRRAVLQVTAFGTGTSSLFFFLVWHTDKGFHALATNMLLSGNNYNKIALLFKFMDTRIVAKSTFFAV